MSNVVTPGLAVTYIRSTGEHAPATIIGRSTRGDDFIHLKYMRNGHEIEHHAPFDRVLFPIRSPSPSPSAAGSEASGTRGRSPTRSGPPPVRVGPAPPQLLCLLVGSLPPQLKASHITLTTTEELQLGSGHVFEGKLYFTKDIVDDNFVPRNRKPKPIPKPAAQPAPEPAPKGKHVQLFKMREGWKGFLFHSSRCP